MGHTVVHNNMISDYSMVFHGGLCRVHCYFLFICCPSVSHTSSLWIFTFMWPTHNYMYQFCKIITSTHFPLMEKCITSTNHKIMHVIWLLTVTYSPPHTVMFQLCLCYFLVWLVSPVVLFSWLSFWGLGLCGFRLEGRAQILSYVGPSEDELLLGGCNTDKQETGKVVSFESWEICGI